MEPRLSENAFEPLREAAISDSVLTHPALAGRRCWHPLPGNGLLANRIGAVAVMEQPALMHRSARIKCVFEPDLPASVPNLADFGPQHRIPRLANGCLCRIGTHCQAGVAAPLSADFFAIACRALDGATCKTLQIDLTP